MHYYNNSQVVYKKIPFAGKELFIPLNFSDNTDVFSKDELSVFLLAIPQKNRLVQPEYCRVFKYLNS